MLTKFLKKYLIINFQSNIKILKMYCSEKNVSSFETSSTGTCLSQSKKYFLSLINPHNLDQYKLLNLMERNGYFASNNIESNKKETKNSMVKNVKKYKNNKIGLKYIENEDASFNNDKMDNIFLNHNSKKENFLKNYSQKNGYTKDEISDNNKSKKMNNSLESRHFINNLLRNQKNKIKEIKSKISDNISGISFSSSSSFENSNSIELNCNNQNDNSQDWNTKQIYVEYNNNFNNNYDNRYYNSYNKNKCNKCNDYNSNNKNNNNDFHIDNSINDINNNFKNADNQFDNSLNNNKINNYYNIYKGNDNNYNSDIFNNNFGIINENKKNDKDKNKDKNEINRKTEVYDENKIENVNIKINNFEKRNFSRSPLKMADVFMIKKKSLIPYKKKNKNEYKESIAFNNKNIKTIIYIKKSESKLQKQERDNDKMMSKKNKDEINEERKEIEKNDIKSAKEKEEIKNEIELKNKNNKENLNKKINEIREKIKIEDIKESTYRNNCNKENEENKEFYIINKIINDKNESKRKKEINKENREINKDNKEHKGNNENKDNKENKENKNINDIIINSINRNSEKSPQSKNETILMKINNENNNKINGESIIKEIKRNSPLRDNYNNIKDISNNEIIKEKNNLISNFKVINYEYVKRTTPSIRRRFKNSKNKISSYIKNNNEQNIINKSLKRIVSNENIKRKDSTKININRINLEVINSNQSNKSANNNKDKKQILIEKSINNTNIFQYKNNMIIENRNNEKVEGEKEKDKKDKIKINNDEIDEEDNDDKDINFKKFHCESSKEERIKRTRKLFRKEDNKEDENIIKFKSKTINEFDKINNLYINKKNEKNKNNNLSKKKNINTFSFENLFCVNKNQNKFYQNKKEENDDESNDLSSYNNNSLRRNKLKEKNRKNKKEEEIKKNEEENNNKKKENIDKEDKKIKNNNNIIIKKEISRKREILNNQGEDKIESIDMIRSLKNNENIKKKKRITILENILVEEINTTKPVVKTNISQMFLKKNVNLYNNNLINNLLMNKRQNSIKSSNNNKIEKMNKNIYLFGFDEDNNFLQFDLRKKKFKKRKISELEDLSDIFEQEYIYQNTLLYNTLIGSFILTGKNCDILFYYNSINETIIKICQFKYSHHLGCLLLDQENNRILIFGGKTNICEIFSFDTEEVKEIPNLNFDRASASYIISKDKVFGFFGFSFKKGKYLYNIEYINKNILDKWEVIDLNFKSKEDELSFHLKNISTFNYENDQNKIIIYGGKQGRNEKTIDGYYYLYEVDKNKFLKMEGLYYNIIKDLKFINIWKNSELIDFEEKSVFFFDKQKQILELPDEDKIIDGHNIYTSIIIDSENNIHYLTNNQKYITVYKYISK